MQFYPDACTLPGVQNNLVFLVGKGAGVAPVVNSVTSANLTTSFAQGITTSYIATGRFNVIWTLNYPGIYLGFGYAFRDTSAQSNVKGYNATAASALVAGTNSSGQPTWSLEVDIWNGQSAYAAVDLATTNLADLFFAFKTLRA